MDLELLPNRVQPDFQRSARRNLDVAKETALPASKAVRATSALRSLRKNVRSYERLYFGNLKETSDKAARLRWALPETSNFTVLLLRAASVRTASSLLLDPCRAIDLSVVISAHFLL
jgi:hypothetical protein